MITSEPSEPETEWEGFADRGAELEPFAWPFVFAILLLSMFLALIGRES